MSDIQPLPTGGGAIGLGNSIIFSALSYLVLGAPGEGYDVFLHPVAFAGWIGLFVTALNLLPIGQLDGGHILYAVKGRYHRFVSLIMVSTLALLGLATWGGWLLWAILVTIIGIGHPPVAGEVDEGSGEWTEAEKTGLERERGRIGYAALIVFILTFTPLPFYYI